MREKRLIVQPIPSVFPIPENNIKEKTHMLLFRYSCHFLRRIKELDVILASPGREDSAFQPQSFHALLHLLLNPPLTAQALTLPGVWIPVEQWNRFQSINEDKMKNVDKKFLREGFSFI